MKLAAFGDGERWSSNGARVGALPPIQQRLLWAIRRLALMQPLGAARCHAVYIALQQDFGDVGLGIEHLLRCWLVGLSRLATRRLVIGAPACPLLTDDEALLLRALALPEAEAAAELVAMTGAARAAGLTPLFAAVQALTEISLPTPFTN